MSESVLVTQGQVKVTTIESKEEGSAGQDDKQAFDELEHNSDLYIFDQFIIPIFDLHISCFIYNGLIINLTSYKVC